jgi:hypothetical protein
MSHHVQNSLSDANYKKKQRLASLGEMMNEILHNQSHLRSTHRVTPYLFTKKRFLEARHVTLPSLEIDWFCSAFHQSSLF